jgi:hypothetical protein
MPALLKRRNNSGRAAFASTGADPSAVSKSVEARCIELGVDPFHIIAMIANGDCVALGWMTQEEFDAVAHFGKDSQGRKFVMRASGREMALGLTPPGMRLKAAVELAAYIHGKKSVVTVQNPDGSGVGSNVAVTIVKLPDNGRTKC